MPFESRQFYKNAATSVCEAERRMWQLRAKIRRKKWVEDMRLAARRNAVHSGRVLHKSKKLHSVKCVIDNDARHSNLDDCGSLIAAFFGAKYGFRNLHCRSELSSVLAEWDGSKVSWSLEDISAAFRKIRKGCRRNFEGVCVRIMEFLFIAQPETFSEWLSTILASRAMMSDIVLGASPFGKTSSTSALCDIRVVIPLTAFLQIADVLLATKLD